MESDRGTELAGRLKRIDHAAGEAEARVAEAERAMQALLEAVKAERASLADRGRAPEPAPQQPQDNRAPARDDPYALDAARLVAIEMADAGATREEVELHLRAAYAVTDPSPLLDDVFGERESRQASSL